MRLVFLLTVEKKQKTAKVIVRHPAYCNRQVCTRAQVDGLRISRAYR